MSTKNGRGNLTIFAQNIMNFFTVLTIRIVAIVSVAFMLSASADSAAQTNMTVEEVLASGCVSAPRNMSLSDFWESKMGVLESWCDYPVITAANINGQPKPHAYLNGSSNVPHDLDVASIINGTGNAGDELGFAPRTPVSFGLYCSDGGLLANTKTSDVAFSLRAWSSGCQITNPSVPLIPIFGGLDGNNSTFIGNQKTPNAIHLSSGGNYGLAIDYFVPGGASTVIGGGNVSYALPELAGTIVALNTVLIAEGKSPLTRETIKTVLNASSDEAYLEVNGTRAIYKESEVDSLLQNPSNKYYGQLVNLPNAIRYALTGELSTILTIVKKAINNSGGTAVVDDFKLAVSVATSTPITLPAATSTPLIFNDETPDQIIGDTTIYTSNVVQVSADVIYAMTETNLPGYSEGDWSCTNDGGSGSGGYDNGRVVLSSGESVTCTITNDDIEPSLTIIKNVINTNSGTATSTDFVLHLAGGSLPGSIYDGTEDMTSGDAPKVEANAAYTLSEDLLGEYEQTSIQCLDDNGGTDIGHPVTLAEGQSVTCTITNNDTPRLIIFKEVINDNGGQANPADFILRVTGGSYDGSINRTSGDSMVVEKGVSYVLSEQPYTGYTQTGIACVDYDTAVSIPHPIILAEGQSAICTISNDDNPLLLTIVKEVINNDGGSASAGDFILRVSGGDFDDSVNRSSGELLLVDAYTSYTLSEDELIGYSQASIRCIDDDSFVLLMHPISLTEGQSATCTITNDDIAPELTIIKEVINENEGEAIPSDFILRLEGGVLDGSLPRASGDLIAVNANTVYTLSEDQRPGYSLMGITCKDDAGIVLPHPVTLAEGQSVTCTISNIDDDGSFYVIPLPSGGASVFYL